SGPDTPQPAVAVEMAPTVWRPAARRAEQSLAPATTCAHGLYAGPAASRGAAAAPVAAGAGRPDRGGDHPTRVAAAARPAARAFDQHHPAHPAAGRLDPAADPAAGGVLPTRRSARAVCGLCHRL